MWKNIWLGLFLAAICIGCGHTQSFNVGLMSFGNLEGKTIPDKVAESVSVNGESCSHGHLLSDAVRDALKQTQHDTIIDAEVTTTTGFFIWSNCISVKGSAFSSSALPAIGGK